MIPGSKEREPIGLFQFLGLFWQRRLIFVAVFTVVLVLSGWQGAHVAPVYRSRASIEIGNIGKFEPGTLVSDPERLSSEATRPIENGARIVSRLRFTRWGNKNSPPTKLPRLQQIGSEWRKNIITLVVYDAKPEAARAYLQAIGDKLIDEHQEIFGGNMADMGTQLSQLRRLIADIQAQTDKIPRITASSRPDEVMLVVEKLRLLDRLPGLLQRQTALERAVSPINNRPTRYLQIPTAERKPVSHGLAEHLVIGALLGLLMAGLSVLVLGHLRKTVSSLARIVR